MRAAVYLRVSTDKQDVRNSVARQLAACRTWAASTGAEILEDHVYRDEVVSGSTLQRPGLQRILRILRARPQPPFDALLVDDSSRLDRGGNLAELVRMFAHRGVALVSVDSGRDLTAEDEELLVHVKAGLDSHYLREIARRTRAGLTQRALKGFWTGGRVYGYALVKTPEGTRVEIDRAQAKVIRRIFAWRAAGAGFREIALRLNAGTAKSARGGSWDATAIRAILRNPKYRGDFTWNVRRWRKRPESMIGDGATSTRRAQLRPASERIELVREDLRIIPDDLWEVVAATFAKRQPGKQATRSPLAGLIRCACGGPIVRGGGIGRLSCGWARNRGPSVCRNSRTVPEGEVLRAIAVHLEGSILRPDVIRKATAQIARKVAAIRSRSAGAGVEAAARFEVATLDAQVARLVEAIASGLDSPAVRASLATREAELERARERVALARIGPGAVAPADPAAVKRAIERVLSGLSGQPAATRDALRSVIAGVIVTNSVEGWRLKVTTRPWVLGAKGGSYPIGGSGGLLSCIGSRLDTLLAAGLGRGRVRPRT